MKGCFCFGPLELKREFDQLDLTKEDQMNACETALQQKHTGEARELYMAFELGEKNWKLALSDGFWLHRWLIEHGIYNIVVDPASIEVNRRARRAKTDRLDGGKLLAMLIRYHAGERRVWSVLRVPTPEQEDARRAHRELERLGRERTAHINRIRALLVMHNLRVKYVGGRLWQRWWAAHCSCLGCVPRSSARASGCRWCERRCAQSRRSSTKRWRPAARRGWRGLRSWAPLGWAAAGCW